MTSGTDYNLPDQVKYFYFSKFSEKQHKKKEKDFALSKVSLEERIIMKNIKTLLYEAEYLEQYAFVVKNKNMVLEILKVIEQLMERTKAQKRFGQSNYDWSSQLILQSIRNRFCMSRSGNQDFQKFIQTILGVFEREITTQNENRNMNLAMLLKYVNQMNQRIGFVEADRKCLETLFRVMKRSEFIDKAELNLILYRFE